MNELLYSMIFKRKSFHVFKSYLPFLPEDLAEIEKAFNQFIPLISNIKVKMQVVSKDETTCKCGCILRSLTDYDAYQSGRCAEHNGHPETVCF